MQYLLSLLVFLNKGFKFQPYIRNKYYGLLMMYMNLSNIASLATLAKFSSENSDKKILMKINNKYKIQNNKKNNQHKNMGVLKPIFFSSRRIGERSISHVIVHRKTDDLKDYHFHFLFASTSDT